MGKRSKEIQRKIQTKMQARNTTDGQQERVNQEVVASDEVIAMQQKAIECKENGQYNNALELLVQILQKNYVTTDILYEIAEIYYLVGDYERTLAWIQNTLKQDAGYKEAVLLSVKVNVLQDKMDDALRALNQLVLLQNTDFDAEYEEKIQDIFSFALLDVDEEELQKQYPAIWESMHKEFAGNLETDEAASAEEEVFQQEFAEEEKQEVNENPAEESIEVVQKEVMEKQISLVEKVELCNSLAQDYFIRKDFTNAMQMLNLAVAIDRKNDLTIKNLGFVFMEMGDTAAALQCFEKVIAKDIMVAKLIKDLQMI